MTVGGQRFPWGRHASTADRYAVLAPAHQDMKSGWLGRGIVVCAGCSPPRRGTSPRATFSHSSTWFDNSSNDVSNTGRRWWVDSGRMYRGTGPAFDREVSVLGVQGYSGGWDGGLWTRCAGCSPPRRGTSPRATFSVLAHGISNSATGSQPSALELPGHLPEG